ncbi:putative receptor-like protein kinase [Senna tora]|uniref:Putative receptor-like protein kinase n=1 Tax=Senna tora TaxID=362788 RepID=A0A834WQ57_9FABA|nr:putative receptor-like protein kinase [Senna tora]
MDTTLVPSAITEQVAMCIQLALLCTQGDPQLRPNMHRVMVVLSKKPGHLEEPSRPGALSSRYGKHNRTSPFSSTTGSSSESGSHTFVSSNKYSTSIATTSATATVTTSATKDLDPRRKRPM